MMDRVWKLNWFNLEATKRPQRPLPGLRHKWMVKLDKQEPLGSRGEVESLEVSEQIDPVLAGGESCEDVLT